MKKIVLLLSVFLIVNNSFAQVNYGSCQTTTSGSPCFFGFFVYIYVTEVKFGTLNYTNGTCDDGSDDGYQDLYGSYSGTVTAGATYTFTVSRIGNTNGGWFSAWVDWNNNANFTDTNELLFTVTGAKGALTQTFSITVPANATPGDHRLRVRSDGGDAGGNPNACSAVGPYGDTKDFKITVSGGVVCDVNIHTPYDNAPDTCVYGCSARLWAEPTGQGPFLYSWAPVVAIDSIVNNACAGTYTVTMTDNNGCTATDTVTISQPDSISITAAVTSIHYDCDTLRRGCADILSVDGGVPAYNYLWSTSETTSSICVNTTGSFCVVITDAQGCMLDTCFIIPASPTLPLSLTLSGQDPTCSGCTDGVVNADASGGTRPYTYIWTPNISSDSTATGLADGEYIVCVTDSNNCMVCDSITIAFPLHVGAMKSSAAFIVSPNPASEVITISSLNSLKGIFRIEIYNLLGEVLKAGYADGGKQTIVDIKSIPAGIYFVHLANDSGRWVQRFIKE